MPLDTALFEQSKALPAARDDTRQVQGPAPADDIGAVLRRERQSRGLSIEDIAAATRVHSAHIRAIEALDIARLPARAFTIGYVRAYARALGLESESVARRFRAETPSESDSTPPAPAWTAQARPSLAAIAVVALVALAFLGWNLTRRVVWAADRGPLSSAAGPRVASSGTLADPVRVGAPIPAPPEAATPPVYQTPGLAAPAGGPGLAPPDPSPERIATVQSGRASRFVAGGAVYTMAGPPSAIILQARTATSLIVRGAGGAVYFARQLSAGEAWRAPAVPGLIADVGNPAAMEVFVSGLSRGVLSQAKTPLSRLPG